MGFKALERFIQEKERKEKIAELAKKATTLREEREKLAKQQAEEKQKEEEKLAKQQAEEEKKRLEELSRKSTAHSWLSGNIVTTRQGLDALGELEGFQIDWEKWDSIVNKTREKNGLPPLDVEAEMAKEEEEEVTMEKKWIAYKHYLTNAERDAIMEDIYNGKL